MKFIYRSANFVIGLVLISNFCLAQSIELKTIQFKDSKLLINYDLLDSLEGRYYSIRVYCSADGFLNPLTKVSGDIGLEVKPGKNKTITWNLRDELPPEFGGKVAVEIRGKIFIPFINTEEINKYKVFKRKRNYNLTWSGGSPQNVLNFDLYNGEKKVLSFPNLANVGHHTFEFPTHVKPRKNYRFRISDAKNKEEVVFTNTFKIKRKIPLLLKAIPVLAIGYGVYALLPDDEPAEESVIVAPPKPKKD